MLSRKTSSKPVKRSPAPGPGLEGKPSGSQYQRLLDNMRESKGRLEARAILRRVASMFPDELQAVAWFEHTPIPGYGSKTARDLVNENHAAWVTEYLDSVEAGAHV